MIRSRIFRKTAKGIAEVESTVHSLDRLARRMLILIDGHSRADELAPLLTPGEAELVFVQLQADGYIEPIDGAAPSLAARFGFAGTAALTFAETRVLLAHEVEKRLGEFAGTVNAELEACVSITDLSQKLREIDRFVMAVLGNEEGAMFTETAAGMLSRTQR